MNNVNSSRDLDKEIINVLHVDDEQGILDLTKKYRNFLGYETIKVESLIDPNRVMAKLREKRYDAIISDYQMNDPVMDGLKLLRQLRAQKNNVPFIIFTGRGREEVAIKTLNLGADYYIRKGGDPKSQYSELFHVIQRVVSYRRTEEALREEEKKYRTLFQEVPIGILTSDLEGNIQSVNKAALELLGSPSEEQTKRINLLHFPLLVKAGLAGDFRKCLEEERKVTSERSYTSKWGRECLYRYKVLLLREKTGKVEGLLCSFYDISDRKKVEEALKDCEQKLKTLVMKNHQPK